MSKQPSFQVTGPVAGGTLDALARLADALQTHPWGGATIDVLLTGDLVRLLERHMPPARFQRWKAGYHDGRIAVTGAISFVTADGRRAAAVPALDDQSVFLMLAAHEMVEAALERRHDAEGHVFQEQTHTSLAHVLWTEYVTERTRRQLFDVLDLGYSPLDKGFVAGQLEDIARELPDLVRWAATNNELPQRMVQHWYELARVYSMSLGRADENSPEDVADLAASRQHWLMRESAAGWQALDESLRSAFDQPEVQADDLDLVVRNQGWMPLYEGGLGGIWNPRYQAAGGR